MRLSTYFADEGDVLIFNLRKLAVSIPTYHMHLYSLDAN